MPASRSVSILLKPDIVTKEMIYELAKDVQSEVNQLEQSVRDLVQGQLRIRKDINDVRGDIIRHDENFARLEVRLDRIEKRLDLVSV